MKKVNDRVIIASDQEMIDAGIIKCVPREDEITLWTYDKNIVWKEMQWTPIMRVFTEPLLEDIKDETGRVIEQKSTHRIDDFYGAPVDERIDLRRYLVNFGIDVEPIKQQ